MWRAAVALLAAELAVEVGRTVVVDHSLGVDTIALVAMVGALALGQELAGVVIGLMFSGGAALEELASRAGAPRADGADPARPEGRAAARRRPARAGAGRAGRVGDVVVVRTGEVVPVDGTWSAREAVVDTSTLSGEPLPVTVARGHGGAQRLGQRRARRSTCAPTVRRPRAPTPRSSGWCEQAQTQRAPFVRMADRYAGFFLPATLLLAGAAWALSGDPVRALAVVVVATPCPLILAAPIALVSGLSRAARSG